MTSFITSGVCASKIDYNIDDAGLVRDIRFDKGCPGNARAVALLAEGRPASEVASILRGITCGHKPTSCPDQFAQALQRHL